MSKVVVYSYQNVLGLWWAEVDGMRVNGFTLSSLLENLRAYGFIDESTEVVEVRL